MFFGTPAFALPSLVALHAAGHEIALVVTQPDRPAGRGQKTTPPPVAAYAHEQALPLWQTPSLRGEPADAVLRAANADVMALAAFAELVPTNVLEMTRGGILNVHPSLLPRWRGAAPIQSALAAGDIETGVSIIRLVKELDAGPILLQERAPIAPEDDYVTLEPRLAAMGGALLVRAVREQPTPSPQDASLATYSRRIEREDARIDWTEPSSAIFNKVRAYRGWPGAFTSFEARQLKILRAWPADGPAADPGSVEVALGVPLVATGAGWLRLDEIQLEGRRAMSGADLLRGYPGLARAKLA
ncbi:MAG TPA: methionyl-tRNA formyltransferase [Chloroflexota bacterium]